MRFGPKYLGPARAGSESKKFSKKVSKNLCRIFDPKIRGMGEKTTRNSRVDARLKDKCSEI